MLDFSLTQKGWVLPIVLNAFPLKIPELELKFVQIPYDKMTLGKVRTSS